MLTTAFCPCNRISVLVVNEVYRSLLKTLDFEQAPRKAPDQNRTDTRSLEGYCSTIELQAHRKKQVWVIAVIIAIELCKGLHQ